MSLLLNNVTFSGLVQGSGILFRRPVVAATIAAGTLATDFENGDIIDGVTLATNDRILIKNQATASENGIYVVEAVGAPTRADDYQIGDLAGSTMVPVLLGTTNKASIFMCTNTSPTDIIGTDNLVFSRSDSAGGILTVDKGGTGLGTLTANRFLVGNGTSAVDLTKVVPTGTVVGTSDSQTLTNKTIDSSNTTFQNAGNATQQITFDLTALTAPRIFSWPDTAGIVATRSYVDEAIQGLDVKQSVRLATTAAGTLATDFEDGDLVDGFALVAGDRILIKNQADAKENGIYEVQLAGAPLRSADADNSPTGEVTSGLFTFVEEGTANAGTGWVLITANPITLGISNLTFSKFSSAGAITAGNGLSQAGSQFDVNVTANKGIVIVADSLELDLSATNITGTLPTSNGGTGLGGANPFTANRFVYSTSTSALDVSTKAVPTGVVVGTTDIQTLTNKTLTSPIINQILDANGNEELTFTAIASAVNQLAIANAATGNFPTLSATGDDANVSLGFVAKGTGVYDFAGSGSTDATLRLHEAGNVDYIDFKVPTLAAPYTFTLPTTGGTNGYVLQTNGSGTTSWKPNLNQKTYTFFAGTATAGAAATSIATSGFAWQQSRYGAGGAMAFASGSITYRYTFSAGGRTLTVAVYNEGTATVLGTETIPDPGAAATGTSTLAFALPVADTVLRLRIDKSAGAGATVNVTSAQIEFVPA